MPLSLHRALTTAAALTLAACERTPTAPTAVPAEAIRVLGDAGVSDSSMTEEGSDFADVVNRILPNVADRTFANQITLAIQSAEKAISAGEIDLAVAALDRVNELVVKSDTHPANIGAIRIAISRAADRLGRRVDE